MAEIYDLSSEEGDDVLRRNVLTFSATAVGAVAAMPLVNALLSSSRTAKSSGQACLARAVTEAKAAYQAGRYETALDRLASLLPTVDVACDHADSRLAPSMHTLAADAYHAAGSVLLKLGDQPMALLAAERSTRHGAASEDPVAVAASARIMTHALMRNGHTGRAIDLAHDAARRLEDATRLGSRDSVAVYGALLLRGAIAAARTDDRDRATALLDEADRAAGKLGHDGNDRWTGFGPTNVLQHRLSVALAFGDAGTAISFARRIPLGKIQLEERKACLLVEVAHAYTRWGRYEPALTALREAYRIAPEEVRARSATQVVEDLSALSRGHLRKTVRDFAMTAGIRL
jgi:tetratricopeptide (TPR) repeat protein